MHEGCTPTCPRLRGLGGEGRGCACSDRATESAIGAAIWMVIAASSIVIVLSVASAIAGYVRHF